MNDDYEEQRRQIQADLIAQFQRDMAEAAQEEERAKVNDPVKKERRLFLYQLGDARARKKISQSELARQAGMKQASISRIEHGTANPSLNTLLKIAGALDADLVLEYRGKSSKNGKQG